MAFVGGYKLLADAVICQAIDDFQRRDDPLVYAGPFYNRQAAITRAEAYDFLTAADGEWAESRRVWAEMAGRSESRLRTWANKELLADSSTKSLKGPSRT